MGWREALAVTMADEQNDNGDGTRSDVYFAPNPSHVAWVEGSMRRLSAADRIDLARELLEGTGRAVAETVPTMAPATVDAASFVAGVIDGWNSCRAAMLGDEG